MIITKEMVDSARQVINTELDKRQVMWELTDSKLSRLKIRHIFHGDFDVWYISGKKYANPYNSAITIEINNCYKMFCITARSHAFTDWIDVENIEKLGFYKSGGEYYLDTSSIKKVFNIFDKLISHIIIRE